MGPIKNIKDLETIKNKLKSNDRDYLIFLIGINTGLKSKDLLNLKVNNFLNKENNYNNNLNINGINYTIPDFILNLLDTYFKEKKFNSNDFIFPGNKGLNKPIDRSHLYRILNNTGIDCKIGNEDLRKTYGYHYYVQTKDLDFLKKIFKKRSKKELINYLQIDIENNNNFKL